MTFSVILHPCYVLPLAWEALFLSVGKKKRFWVG